MDEDPCVELELNDCPCRYQLNKRFYCNLEEHYEDYRSRGEEKNLLNLICKPARIELYCKEENVDKCCYTPHPCPCKILHDETFYCNFGNMYSELMYYQEERKAKILFNAICSTIRDEMLFNEYIADDAQKYETEFLMKSEVGQEIYCTTECDNVILLQKPDEVGGKCKYKTNKGKIDKQWTFCFRIISQGDKSSEYEVKGNHIEKRANYLEILAKSSGLRVERESLNNSCILKFFGGSQEEVDDFIALCCNNDFVLF